MANLASIRVIIGLGSGLFTGMPDIVFKYTIVMGWRLNAYQNIMQTEHSRMLTFRRPAFLIHF
jgi:hypothetical protein